MILSQAPLEDHPLHTRCEPSALERWILEILRRDSKGIRGFLRILSTEGRGVRLRWAHSNPKGPIEEGSLYRGTSLITCGDSENACYFLTKTRNLPKNACLFLKELRIFFKNACLFLTQLRNVPKNACLFLKNSRNCLKNACFSKTHVQKYLAHKNPLPPHRATIGP